MTGRRELEPSRVKFFKHRVVFQRKTDGRSGEGAEGRGVGGGWRF